MNRKAEVIYGDRKGSIVNVHAIGFIGSITQDCGSESCIVVEFDDGTLDWYGLSAIRFIDSESK